MTNDYTDQSPSARTYCWHPCCPIDGSYKPYDENREILDDRFLHNMFQELEDARLGSVSLKAWNKKYESADEVAVDIKSIASTMEIVVSRDEVELDTKWADVLELIESGLQPHARSIRFKSSR
jgi:hypothetical protein